MGTQTTVDSHFYKNNIESNSTSKVYEIAAPKLVKLIEDGKIFGPDIDRELSDYLKIANEKKIPNIILGCTHFPIISQAINKNLNYEANIINPARNIADKIHFKEDEETSVSIFMTEINEENNKLIENILDWDYKLYKKEI